MPDSFLAVAVLLVGIVPGFLFLQGYHRGRSQAAAPDIFVLAKAAVASLLIVTIVWAVPSFWFVESGSSVVDWVRDRNFNGHRGYFLALGWAVFSLAFLGGLAVGWAVDWCGRGDGRLRRPIGLFLGWAGFLRPQTLWETLLKRDLREPKLVEVHLREGGRVIGAFDADSAATPNLGELVLSKTYVLDPATGTLVDQNRRLYLKGEEIVSLFIGPIQ
jgi:hypothetical protein